MKAVLYDEYGGPDVLRLADIPKPTPKPNEILVRIRATSVTSGDARMRAFDVPAPFRIPGRLALGWSRPRNPLLGYDFAGEIEAVGAAVTRFSPGDRVYGGATGGSYAEYRTIAETGAVVALPEGLDFAEAAALPFGALTAMHFLGAAKLRAGQSICIIGASGSVGLYAVQLARHLGAEVTAVCSAANAELVRSFGAARVIDYTTENVLAAGRFDMVLETVGSLTFRETLPLLKPRGSFIGIVMSTADIFAALSPFKHGHRLIGGTFTATQADLIELSGLVATGAIRPVIDRIYRLDEIRDAHAYVDSKRKRGAVVITV